MEAFLGEALFFILSLTAIGIVTSDFFDRLAKERNQRKLAESEFKERKARMFNREKASKLTKLRARLQYNLDVIKMPKHVYVLMNVGAVVIGFFFGKVILTKTGLALMMSILFGIIPLAIVVVRASWYKNREMAMLENCMVTISSSYRANKDIIKSIKDNIDNPSMPVAFKNFLSDVTFVDSSVERALRKVGMSFNNKYFTEWIEVLIKSQKDSTMMDILPVIIDEMDTAKKAHAESAAAMRSVWREYVIWIITCICVPLILRLNDQWYNALINTLPGKGLLFLLMLSLANTLRSMMKISREASDIM